MYLKRVIVAVAAVSLVLVFASISTSPAENLNALAPEATEEIADEPAAASHDGSQSYELQTQGTKSPAAAEKASRPPRTRKPGVRCNAGVLTKWRPSKCNDDRIWLIPWINSRPGTNWTLVDVGANKGYVIAEWLDVLLGDRSNFTARDLGVALFSHKLSPTLFKTACGGCCECAEQPANLPDHVRAKNVKIYGFEPSPANHRWLKHFFTDTNLVNITHAAAAERSRISWFPDQPLGVEIGKVRESEAPGYKKVNVITLEEQLPHLDFIDVLATDAEGFDQEVAKGGERFLREGRVGVYQFELYAALDYEEVFRRLGEWGYICYYQTESRSPKLGSGIVKGVRKQRRGPKPPVPTLVRITDCWEDIYNTYTGWVNSLCYNTKIKGLREVFEPLERTMHKSESGLCPGKVQQQRHIVDFIERHVKPRNKGKTLVPPP